jgi:hypothetical protein
LDHGWKPTVDGIPTELKGSCLIQVPYADKESTRDPALEITYQDPNKIGELYVAFDTRANRPPDWLAGSNNYSDNQTFLITSTELDLTKPKKSGKPPNVKYKVWKHENPDRVVKFGGNNATGVNWPTNKIGSQYLVFVKSKPEVDRSKYDEIDTTMIEVCSTDNTAEVFIEAQNGKQKRLEEWLERPENTIYKQAKNEGRIGIEFQASDCKPVLDTTATPPTHKVCGKGHVKGFDNTTRFLNAWPVRSTAFIDPSQSEIGEISLFGENMKVSGYPVEKISVGQRRTLTAECADNLPKDSFRLCTDYEILPVPTGNDALVGVRASVKGDKKFTSLRNKDPIPIKIDLNNRQFTMSGGPILSKIEQMGEVQLWLKIVGKFINFAPVASTAETPKGGRFPCIDKNQGKTELGSASSDRDQSPLSLSTSWVEDAGLLSERVLGNEQILNDVLMNFGGHAVTLFVKDNKDVETRKTITVEVYDPQLDHHDPPQDVFAQSQEGQSTVVDIGKADGDDNCSGDVNITNNAPAGLRFPLGYTPIDWTFDDYNGNVIFHRQKVFVVPPDYYHPPIAESSGQLQPLPGGTQKFVYEYKTIAKNKVIHADEYIYISAPSGDVYFFDEHDQLRGPNIVVPHAQHRKFGNNNTQDSLTVEPFDTVFPEKGVYTVSYTLVQHTQPYDPLNYIAHDQIELDRGSPP